MDLVYIFKVLLKKIWIIITIPLIAAVAAFLVVLDAQEMYRSSAQISTGFTINDQVKITDEKYNPWEADIKFNNLIETLRSPVVVGLLSYKLILHDLSEATPYRRIEEVEKFNKEFNQDDLKAASVLFQQKLDSLEVLSSFDQEERRMIDLLKFYGYDYKTLTDGLYIRRVNYSDYIAVDFVSENPQLSAFVVNTLVQEFLKYNNLVRNERTGESVEFFARLLEQKKEKLQEKSDLLRSFQSASKVINFETESEAKVTQISDIEQELQEEQNKLTGFELQLKSVKNQIRNLSEAVITDKGENSKILELREKINELNSRYISSNFKDKELEDNLNALRKQLKDEISKSYNGPGANDIKRLENLTAQQDQLMVDVEISRSKINSLKGRLGMLNSDKSDFADKKTTIAALEREVQMASDEYSAAQEKYNEAKNASMAFGNTIKQVVFGQPAIEPEPSKILIITGLAGMVSFAMCVFVIVFVEYVDLTIRTPPNFIKETKLPLAGSLNQINASKLDLRALFGNALKDKELETFKHLLRKLRYEIDESGDHVFLFTSTKPGEGKSFIILTLAYSLSMLQKRILIVDTNFKHNTLTQTLAVKPQTDKLLNNGEVSKYLLMEKNEGGEASGEMPTTARVNRHNIISPTHFKNIDIICSASAIESPAEILSGKNFNILVEELKHHYDYIFMEGAALNEYSDTKELVKYAQRIIPVFSAKSVIKQLDKESIQFLRELNGKLMGSILNKVDQKNLNL